MQGSIDQVDGVIQFTDSSEQLEHWDQQIMGLCQAMNDIIAEMGRKGLKVGCPRELFCVAEHIRPSRWRDLSEASPVLFLSLSLRRVPAMLCAPSGFAECGGDRPPLVRRLTCSVGLIGPRQAGGLGYSRGSLGAPHTRDAPGILPVASAVHCSNPSRLMGLWP